MLTRTLVGFALVAVPSLVLLLLIDATLGALLVGLLSTLTVVTVPVVEWVGIGHPD